MLQTVWRRKPRASWSVDCSRSVPLVGHNPYSGRGAEVTISQGFQTGDILTFTSGNGITGTYANGVLTLTGITRAANYQTALQSVTFASTTDYPTTNKTITFTVSDGATAGAATKALLVSDAAPVLTVSPGSTAYTEQAPPVAIDR